MQKEYSVENNRSDYFVKITDGLWQNMVRIYPEISNK
jgi:hypothetical protein